MKSISYKDVIERGLAFEEQEAKALLFWVRKERGLSPYQKVTFDDYKEVYLRRKSNKSLGDKD